MFKMDCVNEENVKEYFVMLKEILLGNNLMEKPVQIYNVDDHHPLKVKSEKGQKQVWSSTSGNKIQITIIACVSAVVSACVVLY